MYCGLNRSRVETGCWLAHWDLQLRKTSLLIINRVIVRAVIKAVLINYRQGVCYMKVADIQTREFRSIFIGNLRHETT